MDIVDQVDEHLGAIHKTCGSEVVIRVRAVAYSPYSVTEPYCEQCGCAVALCNVEGRLPAGNWALDQLM